MNEKSARQRQLLVALFLWCETIGEDLNLEVAQQASS